jgi:hypothetical protein
MIGLFAKQLQTIKTLVTVLESRESWKYGDLAAFHDVTSKDSHINDDLITHAAGSIGR